MKNTILYAALALLTLSGGAVSQEAGNNTEAAAAPDSVVTAAPTAAQEPEIKGGETGPETETVFDNTATALDSAETVPDSAVAAQEPEGKPDIAADVIDDGADDEKAALEQAVQQTKLTKQPKRKSFWIALSADVAGAGIWGIGIYEEMNVRSLIDKGKFSKSAKAETVRNVCYVIGTVVLASGISIHIFF